MKKLTLHTDVVLSSSHYLRNYQGLCSRQHGHDWKIEVWVKGYPDQLDEIGILLDFSFIKKIKEKYDHNTFNEIPPFDKINPTAENMAIHFYNDLKANRDYLEYKVRVYEAYIDKKAYCEYGDFE